MYRANAGSEDQNSKNCVRGIAYPAKSILKRSYMFQN